MTGLAYTVKIENAELEKNLDLLFDKFGDLEPFHKSVGEYMLGSIQENFENESAPDGTKWQFLSPVTTASRLRRHGNAQITILRESGRLAGSFNYEAGSEQVEIGTPIVYAAIHHFGGQAGRNKSVTIPERPILGVGLDDEIEINEIAKDFLNN